MPYHKPRAWFKRDTMNCVSVNNTRFLVEFMLSIITLSPRKEIKSALTTAKAVDSTNRNFMLWNLSLYVHEELRKESYNCQQNAPKFITQQNQACFIHMILIIKAVTYLDLLRSLKVR